MEALLLALQPFVVSALTKLLKPLAGVKLGKFRKIVLRLGVALLSFGAALGGAVLAGSSVDPASLEAFAQALLNFLGASGVYFFAKKK